MLVCTISDWSPPVVLELARALDDRVIHEPLRRAPPRVCVLLEVRIGRPPQRERRVLVVVYIIRVKRSSYKVVSATVPPIEETENAHPCPDAGGSGSTALFFPSAFALGLTGVNSPSSSSPARTSDTLTSSVYSFHWPLTLPLLL